MKTEPKPVQNGQYPPWRFVRLATPLLLFPFVLWDTVGVPVRISIVWFEQIVNA